MTENNTNRSLFDPAARMFVIGAVGAVALASAVAWGWDRSLVSGIVTGGAWNVVNMACLAGVLRSVLGAPKASSQPVRLGWVLAKFPGLYLVAWWFLGRGTVSWVGFGIGFSIVLVVAMGVGIVTAQQTMRVSPTHGG